MKRIATGSPFEAKVGYCRAVVDGDMVYVSGTTGYDYSTMTMPEDAGEQARNALNTIGKALAEAGTSFAEVLRVHYFITDAAYYEPVGDAAAAVFSANRPTATMVVCGMVRSEMKVEIEVTARIGASRS